MEHVEEIQRNIEEIQAARRPEARNTNLRKFFEEAIDLGKAVALAGIIWQSIIFVTGSPTPVVVVLTGSMEPGIRPGDVLVLKSADARPIRAGDMVVFKVADREIPIVHRVIKVHEDRSTGKVQLLTKGDANPTDDISLYGEEQQWIQREHLLGRVVWLVPYVGKLTLLLNQHKAVKFLAPAGIGLLMLLARLRENFDAQD